MRLTGILILALAGLLILGMACTSSNPTKQDTDKQATTEQPKETGDDVEGLETGEPSEAEEGQEGPEETETPSGEAAEEQAPNWPITEEGIVKERVPNGWPDYIPVIEGVTIAESIVMPPPSKEANVFGSGKLTVERVETFYSNLPGWTKVDLDQWDTKSENRWIKFGRGAERLSVGYGLDEGGTLQIHLQYTIPEPSSE